ncbi:crotonase/enoyl-CoA hydratase family protein [Piscinibacter sp. HJYY11]|uniref:crotonase/enoyl-CoA hydratase family protein n=1 Tax=Piscinibacter sp. HJYY11 TaxID=2801333 RepID=UPI00191D2A9D|nr:crotonase/enoyl-CoA hydratase family protein [Piscinibacter sp. HJYY11]MBL0729172.1 crotonase/enoyl-CoA hydratase family protein [Piscinibacter sp. HJYY11]
MSNNAGSNEERVRISIDERGVAEVALTRADKMNAIDAAMFRAINDAIEQLKTDARVRVVVVHGEGRAFCAGLDMGRFAQMGQGQTSGTMGTDLLTRTRGLANDAQHVAWGWRTLPVPVIAAVHGVAFGGGLQIALGADIRLVHPEAKLAVMEVKWGLVPDMAGIVLMTELMRPDVVRELTYTGRIVSGVEAQAIGLATRVSDDPLADARALAAQIAAQSPDSIRASKRLLNGASPVAAGPVLMAESVEQRALIGSPNQREAALAGLEKRAPVFR